MSLINKLQLAVKKIYRRAKYYLLDYIFWFKRDFSAPSPSYVKHKVLMRNSTKNSIWIETGTYLGETTAFLQESSRHVYTFEPEPTLFSRALSFFSKKTNVTVINSTSEKGFPKLLPEIFGEVNFWLDGHFSSGITYQGENDTPVLDELNNIENFRQNFTKLSVFIDDIRCFGSEDPNYANYPSLNLIVDWAKRNSLIWHIEHDIFIAKSS